MHSSDRFILKLSLSFLLAIALAVAGSGCATRTVTVYTPSKLRPIKVSWTFTVVPCMSPLPEVKIPEWPVEDTVGSSVVHGAMKDDFQKALEAYKNYAEREYERCKRPFDPVAPDVPDMADQHLMPEVPTLDIDDGFAPWNPWLGSGAKP